MDCPFSKDSLAQLKLFIDFLKSTPELIHIPQLEFFREYIKSFGGVVPEPVKQPDMTEKPCTEEEPKVEEAESDAEPVLEFDMTGCLEPDTIEDSQLMGDTNKTEITEEEEDAADEKRREAVQQFNEGDFDKALELYTEAIKINPLSALLFAKRGQVYLKLNKPNACIKDCTRALELNCDSAAAFKFRGRAYRLIAEWEKAAKDLRQACKIDFDEQADEWLREVNPNAVKIEQHRLKLERKQLEKNEKEQRERLNKMREAHAKAQAQGETASEVPNFGGGAPPGMGDFWKLMKDPEIMAAFKDPEVAAAFQDLSTNPANFAKYQSNKKIQAVLEKLSGKVKGSGMGFPGFAGGFPGFGGAGASATNPSDDDGLD